MYFKSVNSKGNVKEQFCVQNWLECEMRSVQFNKRFSKKFKVNFFLKNICNNFFYNLYYKKKYQIFHKTVAEEVLSTIDLRQIIYNRNVFQKF